MLKKNTLYNLYTKKSYVDEENQKHGMKSSLIFKKVSDAEI